MAFELSLNDRGALHGRFRRESFWEGMSWGCFRNKKADMAAEWGGGRILPGNVSMVGSLWKGWPYWGADAFLFLLREEWHDIVSLAAVWSGSRCQRVEAEKKVNTQSFSYYRPDEKLMLLVVAEVGGDERLISHPIPFLSQQDECGLQYCAIYLKLPRE